MTTTTHPDFQTLPRQSLADAVFEQLRGQIIEQRLRAGSALPAERLLCEMLGVNRGAVREGLKRLQQAGLVAIRQGGPTVVQDFLDESGLELLPALLIDPQGRMRTTVARSILRMRESLAPGVAREAAEGANAALADELDGIVAAMRATDELAARQQLAWDFWLALVRGSGNVAYRLAFNSLGRTYRQIWPLLRQVLADEFRDLDGFAALAAAVRAADPAVAERHARDHVRIGTRSMLALLSSQADNTMDFTT